MNELMQRPRAELFTLVLALGVSTGGCGGGDGALPQSPPSPPPPITGEPNVIVDASQTFQSINGWMAALATNWPYTATLRDRIVTQAVQDLGLNRVRLDVTGAVEGNGQPGVSSGVGVNDNNDPTVADLSKFTWTNVDPKVIDWAIPIRQAVLARGEWFQLQITVNHQSNTLEFQKNPAEYAEFVSVVLNRLRDRWGLEPDFWDIANEPENGVVMNGRELGLMLKAAGDRARAEGFHKVIFIGPSVTDARNAVSRLQGMLSVPGAASYLAEATYHRYRNGAAPATLNAIRDFARGQGLQTGQTEFIGADHKLLYADLTEADVSVWSQYTLAARANPNRETGGTLYRVSAGTFEPGTRTWYLRQYFRYVRPGAVRLGASSLDAAIQPVAFRNPDGGVVVVANTSGRATLAIAGLPAGRYQVSYTTASERGADGLPVTIGAGQTLTATIPAAGVITVSR
jgi:hypothetical protein